jgi:hypothetical protein
MQMHLSYSILAAAQWIGFLKPLASPHAYLDPGSGSFLLQLLIAALLGGLFLLKAYWGKISAFFRRVTNRQSIDQDEDE